jgi:hypothetical protein
MEQCTIPCDARGLVQSLQTRGFGDAVYDRLPVIGVALLVLVAAPFVLVAAAGAGVTAVVLVGWALVGLVVVVGQAWLGAAGPARVGIQGELLRLIETNAARIHPPRVALLRERAEALRPGHPYFDSAVTRILQDLREATGEAWRCPCAKRRIYAGPDGESHFEDVDVEMQAGGGASDLSAMMPATGIIFRRSAPDQYIDRHPAPRRQFVITLSGEAEVEASDGEVRRIGPGTVMLAEDTTGKGHITRAVGGKERLSIFVPLE